VNISIVDCILLYHIEWTYFLWRLNANNREGDPMMKLTISAAALIAAAAFITVPANADYVGGGPRVNAEGKCWKDLAGPRDGRYGVWTDCPKAASVGDSTCHLGQLAWEKLHVGLLYFDNCRGLDASGKPIGGASAGAAPTHAAARPRTPSASR
jgi:hypothetical protein